MLVQEPFSAPATRRARWPRSWYIRERLDAQPDWARPPHADTYARERAAGWRQQTPFGAGVDFNQRLHDWRLTEDVWVDLLTVENQESSLDPAVAAYAAACDADAAVDQPQSFNDLFAPLVAPRVREIEAHHARIDPTQRILPETGAAQLMAPGLYQELVRLAYRTLILELHVCRLDNKLEGEDGEARFRSFLSWQGRPENWRNMLNEYPVLARQLLNAARRWTGAQVEFAERLVSDWPVICERLLGADPGPLRALHACAGDTHAGGRRVMLMRFASGAGLVYKPRSLAVDVAFQQLLDWFGPSLPDYGLRVPRVADRGSHGWSELVGASACRNRDEVAWFYRRVGAMTAIFYMLDATDLHYENLIADGSQPYFCDLETLFHPRQDGLGTDHADAPAALSQPGAVTQLSMLPGRIWGTEKSAGVDLSGLGSSDSGSYQSETVTDINTVDMRLVSTTVSMNSTGHRPQLQGQKVNAAQYIEDLLKGFVTACQAVRDHSDELSHENGPLAAFAETPLRCVLRPTRVYGLLLGAAGHPDYLRDAAAQDQLFDKLWLDAVQRPYLRRVLELEQAELRAGDIPLFRYTPAGRDLENGQGDRVARYFQTPALTRVRQRIRSLDGERVRAQCWAIRASFALNEELPELHRNARFHAPWAETPAEVAQAIGDWLRKHAVQRGSHIFWLGLATAPSGGAAQCQWLGNDLYNGRAGIGLFLAALHRLDPAPHWRELACACLHSIAEDVEQDLAMPDGIGGFDGLGGVMYGIAMASELLGTDQWDSCLTSLAKRLATMIGHDQALDVVSGAAGAMLATDAVRDRLPASLTDQIMRRGGDRLLQRAINRDDAFGWTTFTAAPAVGFAHGNAGAMAALAAAAGHCPGRGYAAAVERAWAYEDDLYSRAHGWRDVRNPDDQPPCDALNWCYGAAGIGLGRLRLAQLGGRDDWRQRADADIRRAINVLQQHPELPADGICHGRLGNMQLLRVAAEAGSDAMPLQALTEWQQSWLQRFRENGAVGGSRTGLAEPSLMNGLAGIGYGLLTLIDASPLPQVLSLAPAVK